MINFSDEDIFACGADCLVNPVNTVGVMGKGLAYHFKVKYPKMENYYRQLCLSKELRVGTVAVWKTGLTTPKEIMLFPTKIHFKNMSTLDYIRSGLVYFVNHLSMFESETFAFPALGVGLGLLDWQKVKKEMIFHLNQVNDRSFIIFNPK